MSGRQNEPQEIPELGSSPTELAKGIHQIKIAMENQRRITDARFMQLHQHMELKQGIHPQRALQCFQESNGDEKVFMKCLAPMPTGDKGRGQGGQGNVPKRRPQQQRRPQNDDE